MSGKHQAERSSVDVQCLHCGGVLKRDKFSRHLSRKHEEVYRDRREGSGTCHPIDKVDFERVKGKMTPKFSSDHAENSFTLGRQYSSSRQSPVKRYSKSVSKSDNVALSKRPRTDWSHFRDKLLDQLEAVEKEVAKLRTQLAFIT